MPVVKARPAASKPRVRRATAADIARAEALATARRRASDRRGPLRKFLDAIPGWWAELDKNNTSLYVFHERSRFRRLVWRLLNWRWFDRFVLSVIVTNCVTLAMYDPTQEPDATWNRDLDIVESVFTFVFLAEMALQVVARNFVIGPGAYLKQPWFVLDFCVVVAGVMSFIATALGMAGVGGNVTGVRALRALKPLRTLNGVPGVRVVASVVLDAAPLVFCALVLLAWLFLVFGIVGVDSFAGLLTGGCFQTRFENESGADALALASLGFVRAEGNLPCDPRAEPRGRACGLGETCLRDGLGAMLSAAVAGRDGVTSFSPNPNGGYTSFDDVGIGCLTVFQALTKRGWALAATQIEAAVGDGAFVKSFFALTVLLGACFAARVITAIVVAEYARTSTLEEKTRSSEPNVASGKTRGEKRAAPPYAQTYGQTVFASCDAFLSARWSYQRPFRALVEHRHFEAVTTSLVVANTAAMAFEHHGMSPASAAFLESLNFVFVIAFAAELLVKLAGLGLKEYFADTFNRFDFVIVLVGVAELLFALGGGAGAGALRAFRLVRVLRAAKVFKSSRRARAFSEKLVLDVAAARDLACVALVFVFVFAILGMHIFGGAAPFGGRPFGKHFDDVFSASVAVFEMLTASQWHDAAWRGMDAAGPAAALYFAAWMCVGHFLFLDVLLAMLAFNFARETSDERREREARDAAGVGPGARDALGDADADGSEADARPRGVLDAAGGEVVAARMRRRGAREFAKEVSRMKTWLRQTDQAHFDDSGGEEEDPGELLLLAEKSRAGSSSGGVLGAFGGDAEDFKTSKRSRGGSRTPEKEVQTLDDGDDGGVFSAFNVLSIRDPRGDPRAAASLSEHSGKSENPRAADPRETLLAALKAGVAIPTTPTQVAEAEARAAASLGRRRPLDAFRAAGRSVIAARRFAGEGWHDPSARENSARENVAKTTSHESRSGENANGSKKPNATVTVSAPSLEQGAPDSPNDALDLAVIDPADLRGAAAEAAAIARAEARARPGRRRASAVSRFLKPRVSKWALAERRAEKLTSAPDAHTRTAEDEAFARGAYASGPDASGGSGEEEDVLSGILEERDSNGGTSGPFLGPDARTKRDEDAADAKRARRRDAARKLALSRDASASAAAVVAAEAEASRLAAERAKSARASAEAERSAEEEEKKSLSPRRGAANDAPADTPVDFIDAFLSARSAATPRWMPLLTTRAPHIASDGGASGGAAGFAAVSSLASRLAKLGARARAAAAESRREPTPGPVTESFAPPRFEDGRDSDVAGTTDGDGFDFGRLAVHSDDDASDERDAATRDGGGANKDASLFARVTAARARGVATRRNAAAGRAPPERRAFASLLAEGAAVAAKEAGTYGQSQEAKVGAELGAGAGIAATLRRQEFVDGVDDLWSAPTHQDPVATRLAVAYDQGSLGFANSGTRDGGGGGAGTRLGSSVDALAESVLLKLRDRKERKLAIPPLRDADAFAAPTTEDLALPLELAPTTHARGNAETRNRSFGGKRRFDGVPDRDVVVHVPLLPRSRPPRRAAELTAAEAVDAQTRTPPPVFMKSRSLFLFSPRSPFRRVCFMVAFDKTFETAVVLVILVSSALIAAENPGVAPDSNLGLALSHLDVAFATFFSCEALVKIVAMGFIAHPGAYARDPWHAVDGAVTAASVLAVFARSDAFAAIRAFRVARALRPLRLVKRFRGARVVAASLALAFPKMVDVLLFGLFQHLVFAILGVQLFSGKFWRCTDGAVTHRDECVGAFVAANDQPWNGAFAAEAEAKTAYGAFEDVARFGDFGAFSSAGYEFGGHAIARRWVNPAYNFDNTGNALLSLFVMTTLDRWMEMTARGVDAPAAVGDQPVADANPAAALFFVAFAVVSGVFWTRLLAACVLDAYRRVSAVTGDMTFETPGQKRWADALKMKRRHAEERRRAEAEKRAGTGASGRRGAPHPDAILVGGVEPAFLPRALALRFTRWRPFELFVHACVVANVAVMAAGGAGESARSASTRASFNDAFGWIFVAELCVKVFALGFSGYVRDPWNRLDLVVVLGTLPTLVFGADALGPGVAVLRAFRLGRVFRLFRGQAVEGRSGPLAAVASGVSALFDGLVAATPSIANVGALLFVLLYVYAALAVRLFGGLENAQFVHEDCHFATFPDAAYCLFRVMSGDDWSRVAAETFGGCHLIAGFETGEYSEETCSVSSVAVSALFFVTFISGASFVVLNVFVAVVVDTFAEAASSEGLMATASFFDLLKRKMLLDGFVEALKKRLRAHRKQLGEKAAARRRRG